VEGSEATEAASDGPAVWVVAGCLFEVSLPHGWAWANPGPEVTLLGETTRAGHVHLRFRAEAPGARSGRVELRFRGAQADAETAVVVHVAPEQS
jgi:hypothetical protein